MTLVQSRPFAGAPVPFDPNLVEQGRCIRLAARQGDLTAHTSGQALGNLQGNLVILDQDHAEDFETFCRLNPKPCPIIGRSEPGDPSIPELAEDLDIRRDLPGYRVWRDGVLEAEVDDVADLWTGRSVAFVIGCSFSFEAAILNAGIPMRHIENGANVAMYVTSIETAPAGPFGGPMVVSMRPFPKDTVENVRRISGAVEIAHGAPIHAGDPALIGIEDISRPDFGDPVEILPGEVPVFWACGVTPQIALQQARLPLVITHRPGSMLVTDRPALPA